MQAFFRGALALSAACSLATVCAGAQALARVTVTSFVLSADTPRPHAGEPFHLAVTLQLRDAVPDVENLQLPFLAGLDVLGDVRSTSAGAKGTTYREVLTLVTRDGGRVTIPPATFDAIDARSGKAEEYSSNALTLDVTGASSSRVVLIVARLLVSFGVAIAVLGLVLAGLLVRRDFPRTRPPAAVQREPQPPTADEPEHRDYLHEALERLERDPTRHGALEARGLVWRMVGASDRETLADVMERARTQPRLLALLPLLERAAFTYDGDVDAAVRNTLVALRSMA